VERGKRRGEAGFVEKGSGVTREVEAHWEEKKSTLPTQKGQSRVKYRYFTVFNGGRKERGKGTNHFTSFHKDAEYPLVVEQVPREQNKKVIYAKTGNVVFGKDHGSGEEGEYSSRRTFGKSGSHSNARLGSPRRGRELGGLI